MSAEEKAKEIYDKMKGFRVKNSHRKKCALVVCDEMENIYSGQAPTHSYEYKQAEYWNEVRTEIKKL